MLPRLKTFNEKGTGLPFSSQPCSTLALLVMWRCARACLIFWKTAWLKHADTDTSALLQFKSSVVPLKRRVSRAELLSIAERDGQLFCQSTQIRNASKPLPWWDPSQYLRDLRYTRIICLITAWYDKITSDLKRFRLSWRD